MGIMQLEQLKAAARLYAAAILSPAPPWVAPYRRSLWPSTRSLTPLVWNFTSSNLFRSPSSSLFLSPWEMGELDHLSELFPWEGISDSNRRGLFGTAVGLNPEGVRCIRLYANQEGSEYLKSSVIPKFKPEEELPLFIVEVDSIQFLGGGPCAGGASISARQGSETGTLGAWLKQNPAGYVGVSNNHVIAEFGQHGPKHEVIQPGMADGGYDTDVVGEIQGLVDLDMYKGTNASINFVDVAWFSPSRPGVVQPGIGPSCHLPQGEDNLVYRIDNEPGPVPVWYCGRSCRSSGARHGTAVASSATVFFPVPGTGFMFEEQIELRFDKVEHGDSGSLILTSPGDKIGALLFAGDPGRTGVCYANPWQTVKSATGLKFVY